MLQQDTGGAEAILLMTALRPCSGRGHGLEVYPDPADDASWVSIPVLE